jgi:predicted  nucleic acid-binding Zn-ribbon protein
MSIDALAKEIGSVTVLQGTLEDNIKCLKKNKVIAVAAEYRKAKEDMKKTHIRLATLENDKTHFTNALRDVEALLKKAREEFTKYKTLGDNNVLEFKTGKKDG